MKNLILLLLLALSFGTVTDIDGNIYETVQIGEQLWMAENLKVTHYNNGDEIANITDYTEWNNLSTDAYSIYDNEPSNADIYGNLYNWYAVDDNRGICMDGWHVPTHDEWTALERYICSEISNNTNCFDEFPYDPFTQGGLGSSEGGHLKEAEGGYWENYDGATNLSGFTGLPSGAREITGLGFSEDFGLSSWGWYWTATQYNSNNSWYRTIRSNYSFVGRYHGLKTRGSSVRCLSDESSNLFGCTNPGACNYDETATADDGSCEYEFDCAGVCGGNLIIDCGGVCGGDNSTALNCCGLPFNDDCTSDCYEDQETGECCPIWEVDACDKCYGDNDGTDCNYDGIPDDCEETYTYGYNAGYIAGVVTGQISADENNDGLVDDFPLITILGGSVVVLTQTFEGNYVDAGASCFAGDAEISQNVEVSGDVVNLSSIGTYVVSYNCQDNVSGNQAITKHRTVIVQADYTDDDDDGYDDASYTTGLEEGILLGAQSGDANGDGVLNVLDIVYFVDVIMNP